MIFSGNRLLIGAVKILTTLSLMTGCGGPTYLAPVDVRDQPPSLKITRHIVAQGETLYSIAWRYDLDVNELARANRLSQPYTIYPGQHLGLDLRQSIVSSSPPEPQVTRVPPRSRNAPSANPTSTPPRAKNHNKAWNWPANGRVVARFGGAQALSKGIDIAAEKGESVFAAQAGTVVYAGNGLRGYGNLLIIKHDQNYLSAYAHNHRLLVKEGDTVKAGQQIAEIGSSGTDTSKLHFEIRQNGKPVDPLRYLPPR